MSRDAITSAAEKPRVLVVDDSRLMRKAIHKFIQGEFEATEAEDGEKGWEMLVGDDQIQVVIADVLMPRLDGYALICRIRAADEARIRDVPVIVITGAEDDETRERAFACGANEFITKPIDGARLLECTRVQARLDQTSRKLAHATEALDEQASIDPLTQLNSRRLFVQRGGEEITIAGKRGTELSLVRLDIDNFRAIYGEHGDDSGDRLLVWVANIIIAQTRDGDILARVGGGAFALVRTTNPSSDQVQGQRLADGRTVAETIAEMIAVTGRSALGEYGYSALGAVVGATRPEEAARLRELMPQQIFLVPGFGAQGGTGADVRPCFGPNGRGAIVAASRSVIYAFDPGQRCWAGSVSDAAEDLAEQVGRAAGMR